MRISDNMRYDTVGRSLSELSTRQAKASQVASSGQRVEAPSDDPVAAAELVRLSAAQTHTKQLQSTVSTVKSDAQLSEGVLGEAGDALARLHEIAVQGANDTLGAPERASLADALRVALREARTSPPLP